MPIAESEIHLGGEDYYLLLFLNYFKYIFFLPFIICLLILLEIYS